MKDIAFREYKKQIERIKDSCDIIGIEIQSINNGGKIIKIYYVNSEIEQIKNKNGRIEISIQAITIEGTGRVLYRGTDVYSGNMTAYMYTGAMPYIIEHFEKKCRDMRYAIDNDNWESGYNKNCADLKLVEIEDVLIATKIMYDKVSRWGLGNFIRFNCNTYEADFNELYDSAEKQSLVEVTAKTRLVKKIVKEILGVNVLRAGIRMDELRDKVQGMKEIHRVYAVANLVDNKWKTNGIAIIYKDGTSEITGNHMMKDSVVLFDDGRGLWEKLICDKRIDIRRNAIRAREIWRSTRRDDEYRCIKIVLDGNGNIVGNREKYSNIEVGNAIWL